jgi:MYXO-CTERM domain-containing protein
MTHTRKPSAALGLATLTALGLCAALPTPTLAAAATPITIISGFDSDTIEATSTDTGAKPYEAYAGLTLFDSSLGAGGVPSASFTSNSNSNTKFQFASATGSNALLLSTTPLITGGAYGGGSYSSSSNAYVRSGTLAFTPGKYSSLSFLTASTNQGATLTLTFNYSDGSVANPLPVVDWGTGGTYALQVGYKPVVNSTFTGGSSGRYLYESYFTADPTRTLNSITFSDNADGGGATVAGIFAVSGVAVAPEPGETAAIMLGGLGLLGLIARKRRVNA